MLGDEQTDEWTNMVKIMSKGASPLLLDNSLTKKIADSLGPRSHPTTPTRITDTDCRLCRCEFDFVATFQADRCPDALGNASVRQRGYGTYEFPWINICIDRPRVSYRTTYVLIYAS